MPIQVGAVVQGSDFDKLLARLAKDVADLRPVFARIDRDVTERLRAQFDTQGAALGTPWAPIAPITRELRIAKRILSKRAQAQARRNMGGMRALWDTGALRGSFVK